MIVISDSSPLIALASIGQIQLLAELYGSVVIPEAVWQEVVTNANDKPGAAELSRATWITHTPAADSEFVFALQENLDWGEAEAIALALQLKADLLLMDERLGRRTAQRLGLQVIGVVGILVEAKNTGRLTLIRPILERLRDEVGFHLSATLYAQILRDAGEA